MALTTEDFETNKAFNQIKELEKKQGRMSQTKKVPGITFLVTSCKLREVLGFQGKKKDWRKEKKNIWKQAKQLKEYLEDTMGKQAWSNDSVTLR